MDGTNQKVNRISRDELAMRVALLISQRGTCGRLQVGAVLIKDNRIIATGYNGPPPGLAECADEVCDISKPCTRAIHAEANLIAHCSKLGIPTENTTLYVTHSPCIKCAELIAQAGIKKVVFGLKFRDEEGLKLLLEMGIGVSEAHYIQNLNKIDIAWQGVLPYNYERYL